MRTSFDEAFEAEFDRLHRYLARRLGSPAAEDLAAESFAIAYRRWDDVDPSRPVRPWLYGIAGNLIRHHRRKERRMLRAYARTGVDPIVHEDETTAERVDPHARDARAQKAVIAAALAQLRPAEREVLLMHAWAELSDAEIAGALSLPLGTVKSRLNRAREHMRNHLAASGKVEVGAFNVVEEV